MDGVDCRRCFICLPAKLVVQITAFLIFAFSFWELISWCLFAHVRINALEPVKCYGTRCGENDMFSCAGQEEASMHVVYLYDILAGTVLGAVGFMGAYSGDPKLLKWLSLFLAVFAILRLVVLVWDSAYTLSCGAYCSHVMEEMIFWPTPNWPVSRKSKDLLLQMSTFEGRKANEIVGFNIGFVHSSLVVVAACLSWYVSRVVSGMCDVLTFGTLGPTFYDAYEQSGEVGMHVNLNAWLENTRNKEADRLSRDYYMKKARKSSKGYGSIP